MTFSGGGIITDGGSAASPVQYVKIYDNQVIACDNYGIAFSRGRDCEAYDNRCVASGYLSGLKVLSANVGMYVGGAYPTNAISVGDGTMDTVSMHDNSIGWVHYDAVTPYLNNTYIDGTWSGHGVSITSTTSLGAPTEADEETEWQSWLTKVATAGHTLGANITLS
jgi:hypothetical protein